MARDPYKYYRIEARELIDGLAAGVLALSRNGSDAAAVERLMRLAHTLKGAARVVRQAGTAEHAHAFEDLLNPYRGGDAEVPAETIAGLLKLSDAMQLQLNALAGAGACRRSSCSDAGGGCRAAARGRCGSQRKPRCARRRR